MPISKYRVAAAEDRTLDGIVFASKREMIRYSHLKLLVRAGVITDLELQPVFECSVNGKRIGEYRADFRYRDLESRTTIEDSKGMATPLYKWKKKHVEAQYGIRIIEV